MSLDKNFSTTDNRRPQTNMKGKLYTYGLKRINSLKIKLRQPAYMLIW